MSRARGNVHLIGNALIAAKMSRLRAKTTPPLESRGALEEIAMILVSEACLGRQLEGKSQIPLSSISAVDLAAASCLRANLTAGIGLLEGILRIMPEAVAVISAYIATKSPCGR